MQLLRPLSGLTLVGCVLLGPFSSSADCHLIHPTSSFPYGDPLQTLQDIFPPASSVFNLTVIYPSGASCTSTQSGLELTRKQTAQTPERIEAIQDEDIKSVSELFTLIMIDGDSPSRNNTSRDQILHYVQTDLLVKDGILSSSILPAVPYSGPDLQSNAVFNRYIYLLFSQSPTSRIDMGYFSSIDRTRFDVTDFARENQFGPPIAGCFFRVNSSGDPRADQSTNSSLPSEIHPDSICDSSLKAYDRSGEKTQGHSVNNNVLSTTSYGYTTSIISIPRPASIPDTTSSPEVLKFPTSTTKPCTTSFITSTIVIHRPSPIVSPPAINEVPLLSPIVEVAIITPTSHSVIVTHSRVPIPPVLTGGPALPSINGTKFSVSIPTAVVPIVPSLGNGYPEESDGKAGTVKSSAFGMSVFMLGIGMMIWFH